MWTLFTFIMGLSNCWVDDARPLRRLGFVELELKVLRLNDGPSRRVGRLGMDKNLGLGRGNFGAGIG